MPKDESAELPTQLDTPLLLKKQLPIPASSSLLVQNTRTRIRDVINGKDNRLVVVVGPCSINNPDAALEYATRLAPLTKEYEDKFVIVMRAYIEKPRTTVGWAGLINDPDLDGSGDINRGRHESRALMLKILNQGVPIATEWLTPNNAAFLADCVSWGAIGARTTESQPHRQLVSDLAMPVGFKNSTSGSIAVAVNAMQSAAAKHIMVGLGQSGTEERKETAGNQDTHLILRGGTDGPNYSGDSFATAWASLAESNLPAKIMIDCSHANAGGDYRQQSQVVDHVLAHKAVYVGNLLGFMLESNLKSGRQSIDVANKEYGVSITDPCLGWEETAGLLARLYKEW